MAKRLEIDTWLSRYADAIRRALASCKKQPTWQQYPYGHMAYGQGLAPKTAAKRYLDQTTFGKQACRRR